MMEKNLLRRIGNDLPMAVLIAALGRDGPPSKTHNGRCVFLCPHCGEMETVVNLRNNLAHCFSCAKNLNTIDLLMTIGYDVVGAVAVLEGLLARHGSRRPTSIPSPTAE